MIHEFKTYLTNIKGYSPLTAESYSKDLQTFASWLRQEKKQPRWSQVTRDDIDKYIEYQVNRGLKPATTNRHLASIGALYNYMKRQGLEVENPARYESRRKVVEHVPNTIPLKDIQRAIASSTGDMKIILETLLITGARIQEVLDIRPCDLDVLNSTIRIQGKGKKERLVYTTTENLEHLNNRSKGVGLYDAIFGRWDQREVRENMYYTMRAWSRAKQLSPHAIRHTFATIAAAHGVNATTLAAMMGHNDIRTTQKYVDLGQSKVASAYNQYQQVIN